MIREIKIGKIYKHFKGNLYYVLDIVNNSEIDGGRVVIYKGLYGEQKTWARDYDNFNSEVDHEKYPNVTQKYRFEEYELLISK